ncbi:MAG: hypothetical protein KatS3mg102_0115 [Planctomycetota bacterium]|nr:MAG: hypothetical protein KatS3mg102_0115 [Planctomycetota bacterium]
MLLLHRVRWCAVRAALWVCFSVFAAAARADFSSGALRASVGSSSDAQTTGPELVPGEEVTLLLSCGISDGVELDNPAITIEVPPGLDFTSASLAALGEPTNLTGLALSAAPPFGSDADPTPGSNLTADGSGADVVLSLGTEISNGGGDGNPQDDFFVVAVRLVVREGARGVLPVRFVYRGSGVGLGEAGVDLRVVRLALAVAKSTRSSPSVPGAVEVRIEVTNTAPPRGPFAYALMVQDLVDEAAFDLSELRPAQAPAGYTLAVRVADPRPGLARIVFDGSTAAPLEPEHKAEFSFTLRRRPGRPLPSSLSPALVSADTVARPFPHGFRERIVAASDPQGAADDDGDGLTNLEEQFSGTDPLDADSDDDGVPDGAEPSSFVHLDGDGRIGALDPDSDGDGLMDGTELGITQPVPDGAGFLGTDTASPFFVPDADPATTTDPGKADTDGDGVRDGLEDANRNGRVDLGELDPADPADAAATYAQMPDADGDGIPDAVEIQIGTDPAQADDATDTDGDGIPDRVELALGLDPAVGDRDADDDGIADLDEPGGFRDLDGDGRLGILDPDSDDDGLLDGTELGASAAGPLTPTADTDPSSFVPDADPLTTTDPLKADTDGDGIPDGWEDLDRNGRVDPGETDPNDPGDAAAFDLTDTDGDGLPDLVERANGLPPLDADADDDGVPDGAEPSGLLDLDRDGAIGALDPDSDGDGLPDGTELGIVLPVADPDGPGPMLGTDPLKKVFRPDLDPSTRTHPTLRDTDGDGVPDGWEDLDRNGRVDAGETDPNDAGDAAAFDFTDTDGDGLPDLLELAHGLAPAEPDSDRDGVPDGEEPDALIDTDGDGRPGALDADADNDGLPDGEEHALGTSAVNPDTDGDGLPDGWEVAAGTDPTDPADAGVFDRTDTDGDGLPDVVETSFGSEPADRDSDDDGVADGEEPAALSDVDGDGLPGVLDPDSDGDGLLDGTELGVSRPVPARDGFPGTEVRRGNFRADAHPASRTNPLDPDTDGDGKLDGEEDLDRNGRLDAGETDPLRAEDGVPRRTRARGGGCTLAGPGPGAARGPHRWWPLALLVLALLVQAARRRARRSRPAWDPPRGAPARRRRSSARAAVLVLAAACSAGAQAREGFSAHSFRAVPDGLGVASVVPAPLTLAPGSFRVGLAYDHTDDPVVLETTTGSKLADLVSALEVLSLTLAAGLPANLGLGLELPLVLHTSGRDPHDLAEELEGSGLGDLRVELKWSALRWQQPNAALALAAWAVLPTGEQRELRGQGRLEAGAALLAELRPLPRLRLVAHLGYAWLDGQVELAGLRIDDRIRFGAGVAIVLWRALPFPAPPRPPDARELGLAGPRPAPPPPRASWQLDLEAALDGAVRAGRPSAPRTSPVEVYGGLRADTPFGLDLALGMSFAATEGVPAAQWRLVFALGFTFGPSPRAEWYPGR